jgi:hypothetical protein
MNLTAKDKAFLDALSHLAGESGVSVEMRERPFKHFVLRHTYGLRVHRRFHMTRQGVRWRFDRIFNRIYVSALETILEVERSFGVSLRQDAIGVAQERYLLRKRVRAELGGDEYATHDQG